MEQNYPEDDLDRQAFWIGQLKAAQVFMDPYLEAGAEITKMYNNMPVGERQKIMKNNSGTKNNDERVKASLVFAWVD